MKRWMCCLESRPYIGEVDVVCIGPKQATLAKRSAHTGYRMSVGVGELFETREAALAKLSDCVSALAAGLRRKADTLERQLEALKRGEDDANQPE